MSICETEEKTLNERFEVNTFASHLAVVDIVDQDWTEHSHTAWLMQFIGRPAEAGDLYLIQSGEDTHGKCRYFRLKSFMIFARFILVK